MTDYFFLIPVALGLGLAGLAAFLWSLRADQYEDLEGAAARVLLDDSRPLDDGDATREAGTPPSDDDAATD